jgi:hypothetical protein
MIAPKQLGLVFESPDLPTGGVILTAGTVSQYRVVLVEQTTIEQTISLPTPIDPAIVIGIDVVNTGTASFTISTSSVGIGTAVRLIWNGSAWSVVGTALPDKPWVILATAGPLSASDNYVLLDAGNHPMPTGVAAGSSFQIAPSLPGATISTAGTFFSSSGVLGSPVTLPSHRLVTMINVGGDNWSVAVESDARSNFGDSAIGGTLGTLNDLFSGLWLVEQTTPGVSYAMPPGVAPNSTHIIKVSNTGTTDFNLQGVNLPVGGFLDMVWNGVSWNPAASPSPEWNLIPNSAYAPTPLSSNAISMTDTTGIEVGMPLRYTYNSVTYYGIVSAVVPNLTIDVTGAPLDPAEDIDLLELGKPEKVVQVSTFVAENYGSSVADLLGTVMRFYLRWKLPPARLVQMEFTHATAAGTTQPKINTRVSGNLVSTNDANNGLQLLGAGVWVASSVDINTANYSVGFNAPIEIACTAVGTGTAAADLSGNLIFVLE